LKSMGASPSVIDIAQPATRHAMAGSLGIDVRARHKLSGGTQI